MLPYVGGGCINYCFNNLYLRSPLLESQLLFTPPIAIELDSLPYTTSMSASNSSTPGNENLILINGFICGLPDGTINFDTTILRDNDVVCFCLPNFNTNYNEALPGKLEWLNEGETDSVYINYDGTILSSETLLHMLKSYNPNTTNFYRCVLPFRIYNNDGTVIPYGEANDSNEDANNSNDDANNSNDDANNSGDNDANNSGDNDANNSGDNDANNSGDNDANNSGDNDVVKSNGSNDNDGISIWWIFFAIILVIIIIVVIGVIMMYVKKKKKKENL